MGAGLQPGQKLERRNRQGPTCIYLSLPQVATVCILHAWRSSEGARGGGAVRVGTASVDDTSLLVKKWRQIGWELVRNVRWRADFI